MERIIDLEIKFEFGGMKDSIHPAVYQDDRHMVLIDCGFIGFMPTVERAMEEKGLDCSKLTHIIITHQDHDHMGALADFKEKYPQIKIAAGKLEAPYVSGKIKSLRLQQAERLQKNLPPESQQQGIEFCNLLKRVKPVAVDLTLEDGEILEWCGNFIVIETPGHTPGHISLYSDKHRILIAGDAVVLEDGKPAIANPQYTLDMEKAEESMKKIFRYNAHRIICYHGGSVLKQAIERGIS